MQQNVPETPLAISAKKVCALLDISPTTLWRLTRKKKLLTPLNHICRRNRVFAYADVIALLKTK